MGDFYHGYCDAGHVRVSDAVAASSAFPPGFSALRLKIPDRLTFSRDDPWGAQRVTSRKRPSSQATELLNPIRLTDGGVYDNLGVEPVWETYNTLFVSDAGRPFESVDKSGQSLPSRLRRAADISMEQVAAVRKRWLVSDLVSGRRSGALWTLHTRLGEFPISDKQGYDEASARLIRKIRTDLDAFSDGEIACLENHGYSMADAAVRSFAAGHCTNTSYPFRWPHENWTNSADCTRALARSGKRNIVRDSMRYLFCRT
jgi:NTE family protein